MGDDDVMVVVVDAAFIIPDSVFRRNNNPEPEGTISIITETEMENPVVVLN